MSSLLSYLLNMLSILFIITNINYWLPFGWKCHFFIFEMHSNWWPSPIFFKMTQNLTWESCCSLLCNTGTVNTRLSVSKMAVTISFISLDCDRHCRFYSTPWCATPWCSGRSQGRSGMGSWRWERRRGTPGCGEVWCQRHLPLSSCGKACSENQEVWRWWPRAPRMTGTQKTRWRNPWLVDSQPRGHRAGDHDGWGQKVCRQALFLAERGCMGQDWGWGVEEGLREQRHRFQCLFQMELSGPRRGPQALRWRGPRSQSAEEKQHNMSHFTQELISLIMAMSVGVHTDLKARLC